MDDRVAAVKAALEAHPSVESVELVGSRAEGRAHELSDWDFYVRASDFEHVAADLPSVLAPVHALDQFWDPYANHDAYMVLLRGPTKIDLCFFDRPHEYAPPYEASAETLQTMDSHFWDWILWTEQKRLGGKDDLMRESLELMYTHMLRPMGVDEEPTTISGALSAYLKARDRLEREFGLTVDRTLEREVRPAIAK